MIIDKSGTFPNQGDIEEYHAKVFEKNDVPREAFGGALFSKYDQDWLNWLADKPSEQELAGGNSKAFDNVDTMAAGKNFFFAGGRTLGSTFKDWSKGGTTTKYGSVVNEGDPLGSTLFVDASKEPMPLPPEDKPRRRKPLPENPRFRDYFEYEDDEENQY